jgi:hypothetical protein
VAGSRVTGSNARESGRQAGRPSQNRYCQPSKIASAVLSVLADWGFAPQTIDIANGVVVSAPLVTQPKVPKWNGVRLNELIRCGGTRTGFFGSTDEVLIIEYPATLTLGFTATRVDSASSRVTMMLNGSLTETPPTGRSGGT